MSELKQFEEMLNSLEKEAEKLKGANGVLSRVGEVIRETRENLGKVEEVRS